MDNRIKISEEEDYTIKKKAYRIKNKIKNGSRTNSEYSRNFLIPGTGGAKKIGRTGYKRRENDHPDRNEKHSGEYNLDVK